MTPALLPERGVSPSLTFSKLHGALPGNATHSVLVHTLLTDNLAGYSCGMCLGTLVSLVAYRAWREHGARGPIKATAVATPDIDPPDSIGAKKCPKCRSLMSKYRISSEKSNRLDYCPALRGNLARRW